MPSVQQKKHGRWKVCSLSLSLSLCLSPSRRPCTFSAQCYLHVLLLLLLHLISMFLLPVSVMMSLSIPHVQECLNEPHFVIQRLSAGKLRSSLSLSLCLSLSLSRRFWWNTLWNSNVFVFITLLILEGGRIRRTLATGLAEVGLGGRVYWHLFALELVEAQSNSFSCPCWHPEDRKELCIIAPSP